MRWTETRLDLILMEMIEENALAIRPILRITNRRFTEEVPTLAITLSESPELLINLRFVNRYCQTDEHVKALLLHEFMHVILGHTMRFRSVTRAQNIALDAVINALISRQFGPAYGAMFERYYASSTGLMSILRPTTEVERADIERRSTEWVAKMLADKNSDIDPHMMRVDVRTELERVRDGLYAGHLVADDILELADTIAEVGGFDLNVQRFLIGNHNEFGIPPGSRISGAVEDALRQMSGTSIWRSPGDYGAGQTTDLSVIGQQQKSINHWKAQALKALREAVIPDHGRLKSAPPDGSYSLPVLTASDRRAFLRTSWSDLIPDARHRSPIPLPNGAANVYLDVSGSMRSEMALIITLINRVRHAIRMPLWAFSDSVQPAEIRQGRLITKTSWGTSIRCVLEHVAETKPKNAVIITDGYVGVVDRQLMEACCGTRLTSIITRDGCASDLDQAGIKTVQLGGLPR